MQTQTMEKNIGYLEELEAYQQRISNILESFTDGFFEVDANWTVTYWNVVAEELLLMPRGKILGKNLWEVYQDAIPLRFYTAYHQAVNEQVSVRFEEYFPTMKLWFEVAAFPSGEGLSVYFKDITPRKDAIHLLELEKKKYRDLFNRSPFPQWVYDRATLRFLDVNEAAVRHYGYSREEFMELCLMDIRPVEEQSVLRDILNSNVRVDAPNSTLVRHKKKNGELIDVLVEGNSVDFEGRPARMVTIVDRTAEIRAQQVTEQSIARFDIVSKATSDAIWDWDMVTGKIVWNQGIKGIFGYRQTTFDEAWRNSRIHPDDRHWVMERLKTITLAGGKRLKIEYRFLCADGSYRNVLDRAFILFGPDGRPVRMIGSMQDITERIKHLEKIERQNAKLMEISWLQAHKVRAPLSNIIGLVNLLKEMDQDQQESHEVVARIARAAEELDNVIRKITVTSR
jgi:PAS domain S-box-containing protein